MELVGAVHEPVEDGVGEGRIAEVVVPMLNRKLAGDERGAGADTIVEQFEQVVLAVRLARTFRQRQTKKLGATFRLECGRVWSRGGSQFIPAERFGCVREGDVWRGSPPGSIAPGSTWGVPDGGRRSAARLLYRSTRSPYQKCTWVPNLFGSTRIRSIAISCDGARQRSFRKCPTPDVPPHPIALGVFLGVFRNIERSALRLMINIDSG